MWTKTNKFVVCGNGIAEIEERYKKKVRIFLFFQYFFLLKQFGLSRSSMTKKSGMELWQWHCRNRREKNLFQVVFGNAIAEIEGKKNLWEWICDNGITEIGWKKKKNLLQWHCRNRGEITKSTHILILLVLFFTEIIWFVTFFYGKSNLWNIPYFKYIDYARCKPKKKKKYIDSYVHAVNKKSINQSPQLLISSDSYSLHAIYLPIHHITPKRFFCLFIL